ncbi:IS3 family transposase [Paenibacillus larvae]|uniref:IS3 family transposase n=1 Tax=Paenibacillus larvae TaxID=1464 RepID=UPI000BBD44B9
MKTPRWRASSRISKRKGSTFMIRSLDEAQRRIEEYIHFYNQSRPQRKLKKLTPVEYRRQLAA